MDLGGEGGPDPPFLPPQKLCGRIFHRFFAIMFGFPALLLNVSACSLFLGGGKYWFHILVLRCGIVIMDCECDRGLKWPTSCACVAFLVFFLGGVFFVLFCFFVFRFPNCLEVAAVRLVMQIKF